MWTRFVAVRSAYRGLLPQGLPEAALACIIAVIPSASADPTTRTTPDAPSRATQPVLPATHFRPSWDLDGAYLWLGPVGAAGRIDAAWDSAFGGEAAFVVVHEAATLGLWGVDLGASRWTTRDAGQIWLDGLVGTRILGRMSGLSAGPLLELNELAHPKLGASIGVWSFIGVTPYARIGAVQDLGMFGEVGIHIALPVLRR